MSETESALARLLTAEASLDAMLAEERRRASALVATAEAEAAALASRLDEELAEERRRLEARLAAERDARLTFAEDDARRRLQVYAGLTAAQTEDLAAWVAREVLADAEQTA